MGWWIMSVKTKSLVHVHDLFWSSEILAIHEISEKLWLVVGILIEDSDYGISHSSK
jgi:hypothetical protein